jgi:hypothetical protein
MGHVETQHNDVYVARRKIQEERVRAALVAHGYTETHAVTNIPPILHFKREKRIDFRCANVQSDKAYCKIDFVITTLNGSLVFLEVDEDQHQYGYDGLVSCDMKRMSFVMETLAIELGDALPNIYWLRYNPNAYHVDGEVVRMFKEQREKRMLEWLDNFQGTSPLGIGYAFYDREDGELCVLQNEHYHRAYAEISEDLGTFQND